MVMTAKEFEEFVNDKQKEIDEIMKRVNVIKFNIYVEANKIFKEKGIEGFGEIYDPDYLGVADLTIGDYDSSEYLFPDGFHEYHNGWVPSSQLD